MTPNAPAGTDPTVLATRPAGPGSRVRVGVKLLWLVPGVVGGSEEYTTRLLRGLARLAPPDLDVTLFALAPFRDAHPDLAGRFDTVLLGRDGRRKPERVAAEATWLAREAARRDIDLMHHAGGVVPPGPAIGRTPSVLTIHDLQPLAMPEHFSAVKRRWLALMVPRSARRARLVLTPSDPTSASVVELLGIAADRVMTVPHGVDPPEPVDDRQLAEVRTRYRLGDRMILYPAITYPHKGHTTLVRAFARMAADRPDLRLVLTGGPGPSEAEVAAAVQASGAGPQVRRTGRVPWPDLEALFAQATVLAFPSRFEGFGAPALEAMAGGVPVVAADATALPWVVGDAGVLVDPDDVDAWAAALSRVVDDPAEAARLSAAGRERARAFTWDAAASALVAGYRRAAAMGEDGSR